LPLLFVRRNAFLESYFIENFYGQLRFEYIPRAGENMVHGLTPHNRRPDRPPPEAIALSERVSLTAVIEAVSDVMEAANRHGIVDRALAARIGAQIHLAVAQSPSSKIDRIIKSAPGASA
jgi:hypothetical protein